MMLMVIMLMLDNENDNGAAFLDFIMPTYQVPLKFEKHLRHSSSLLIFFAAVVSFFDFNVHPFLWLFAYLPHRLTHGSSIWPRRKR